MSYDAPTQKFGYLDIKESSKVKGRKLKSWRHRWIVLTKMANMSNDEFAAKLDIYTNESGWKNHDSEKVTFMLENITSIQSAKSRTHPHAFELVEKTPTLVLSGANDLESYSWMLTLQQILTPQQIVAKKDIYPVSVFTNEFSQKWNLKGDLLMSVSPSSISLANTDKTCAISWGLNTLIRFNVDKNPNTGFADVLIIECGPNSPTGQSCFRFQSEEAQEILSTIRQSICLALAQKQMARASGSTRPRAISVTVSEKGFQHLLDTIPVVIDPSRERSESDSSNSITGTSPTLSVSPASVKQEMCSSVSTPRQPTLRGGGGADPGDRTVRSGSELEALVESDEHASADSRELGDLDPEALSGRPICAAKDSGYSIIQDVRSANLSQHNTNLATNLHKVNDESGVELSLRATDEIKTDWSTSDRPILYKSTKPTRPTNNDSIRTMTLPLMSDERRHLPLNPENQKAGMEERFAQKESMTKKRSSSTGDLQAMRKQGEGHFENDYEELDELKASVQKLQIHKKSDSPPALPARPINKNFLHHKLNSSARVANKKKRPFFKKSVSRSDEDISVKTTETKRCLCSDIGADRLRFVSDSGLCVVCQGRVDFQNSDRPTPISKENIISSSHSSLNDLYMSIPEVSTNLTKRRRSSDITPVSSSFYASCDVAVMRNQKQTQESPDANEKGAKASDSNNQIHSTKSEPKPLQYKASDPLISFFLDDQHFLSNPMVTGKISPPLTPPTTPSNIDLLTSEDVDLDSPVSPVSFFPFFEQTVFTPINTTSFVATQSTFNVWPQASSHQVSPTSEALPSALPWIQGHNGFEVSMHSQRVLSEDKNYMTMESSTILARKQNVVHGEESNGVYVGPSHVGPSHVGPSHVGPSHVGPSHVGPSRVGPSHTFTQ